MNSVFCQKEPTCFRQSGTEKSARKTFVNRKPHHEMSLGQMRYSWKSLRRKSSQGLTQHTGRGRGTHYYQRATNTLCTSGSLSLKTSKRSFPLDFLGENRNTCMFTNVVYFAVGKT